MGTKKRPYRRAFLLAIGALWLLVGVSKADPPTTYRAIPAADFTAVLSRMDQSVEVRSADPATPTARPLIAIDQPWPLPPRRAPTQRPPRIAQPRPRTETQHSPRLIPPRGRSGDGRVTGVATWYCWPAYPSRCASGYPAGGKYAAAGPELRRALGHWRGRYVFVNGVRVRLIDWCACGGDHVIDVYHSTWTSIPNQSHVTITW
jgi:hypothetical protein